MKKAKPLPPISIRDRRLRGGRLDLSAGTDRKPERTRREAAIRALMDEGPDGLAVIERVRRRDLDLGALRAAVDAGTWRALVPAGAGASTGVPTLAALIAAAQQTVDATLEPATREHYESYGRALLAHFGPDRLADGITAAEASAFLHAPKRGRHANRGAPWSAGTQATVRATISKMFRLAIRAHRDIARAAGLRPHWTENVWREVEMPRVRKTRHAYLQPAEWRTLARSLEGTHVHAPLALACLAGLRAQEVLHLRTDLDVDLDAAVLHVQPREGEYRWRPKTDRSVRTVEVGGELLAVLRAHRERGYAGARYFVRVAGRDQPATHATLRKWCMAAFGAVGIRYGQRGDGLTLHSLRHTYASWMTLAGVPVTVVAALMGDDPKMVLSTYAHLAPSNRRAAVDTLDKLLAREK